MAKRSKNVRRIEKLETSARPVPSGFDGPNYARNKNPEILAKFLYLRCCGRCYCTKIGIMWKKEETPKYEMRKGKGPHNGNCDLFQKWKFKEGPSLAYPRANCHSIINTADAIAQ